jgi:diguanylate cyclase (GGDEF)-like protein
VPNFRQCFVLHQMVRAQTFRRISRRILYALFGAVLALGAPAGLLLVRLAPNGLNAVRGVGPEIADQLVTYAYVALSTMLVFALFGWVLGRQADSLIELSTSDELTGLLNARGFYQRLGQELARARRSRQPLSLVIIDLDGLKRINDRHGHAAGDRALRGLAETMRDTFRVMDIGARIGGDEFAVVAPNTAEAAALTLAERIRTRAAEPQSDLAVLATTVSLGVATVYSGHEPGADVAVLLKAADGALYDAKRQGGNRVKAARVTGTSECTRRDAVRREQREAKQVTHVRS